MGNKHSSSKSKYSSYNIPPNAVRPSPPGQPQIEVEDETSVFIHWDGPRETGGCPIIGYLVQHSELDERLWHTPNPPMTENHCWIINLKPGAVYIFRVIAENILGYSGPSQLSEPTKLTIEIAPPKFIQELESVNALQHERVEFKARLAPGPPCHMTWFLDNVEVFPDDDHTGVELRGNTLLITKVEADCEVKCLVENEYGASESVAMLVVGVPPRIKEEPHAEHFFRVGEIIRIKFNYSGTPTPTVHWFHDGQLIPQSQYQALSNLTILKISNASRKHRGEYMLRIENTLGQDSSFALVTVADKPSPPSKPTVTLMGDNSCLIEWADGDDDGGCPVTSHTVEYFRAGWDVWLAGTCTRTRSARIRDLIPGSQYIFRVKAENPYGQSDPSESSAQLVIPDLSSASGLMSTVDEIEEEDKSEESTMTFSEEKTKISVPDNRSGSISPMNPRKKSLFDYRDLPDARARSRSPMNPNRISTPESQNRHDPMNPRSRSPVNPAKVSVFDYHRDPPVSRSRSPVNPTRITEPEPVPVRVNHDPRNTPINPPLRIPAQSLTPENRDRDRDGSRSPVNPTRVSGHEKYTLLHENRDDQNTRPRSRSRSPVNPTRVSVPENPNRESRNLTNSPREIPRPGRPDYPSVPSRTNKPITPEPSASSPYKPLTLFDQYSTPSRSSTLPPRISPNPTERQYGSASSLTVGVGRGRDSPDEEGRRLSNYSARSQTSLELDSVRSPSAAPSSSHLIFEEESEGEEGEEPRVTTSSLTLFKTGQTVRIRTASREELPVNSTDVSPALTPSPSPFTLTSPFLTKKTPEVKVKGMIDIAKLPDKIDKIDENKKERSQSPSSKDGVGVELNVTEKTPWSEWVLDWLWLPLFLAIFVKYVNLGVSVVSALYVLYRLFRINK